MSKSANKVPITVRLAPDDKDFFTEHAERCGIEPGVAARQILELYVQRLREGGDWIDALHELKSAWNVPRRAA